MLKLEDINNEIYFEFRRSQMEAMENERLGKIHVSDVIKPCDRYTIYGKIYPKMMSTEDTKSLYFGQVVHSNSQLAEDKHHEKFLAWDYVEDKPLTYEEAKAIPDDDPKHLDIIYGSIDDLMKVGDKWVICDKKTTGSIGYFSKASSKPSESHKDQINRYRVLLHKCYGISADFGCIIYISNKIEKEVRDKPICLSFKLQPYEEIVDDMKKKATIIKDALLNKTLPKRTKCFLCDGMCPYASKCFTDNRESYED
tara:strand:- start:5688 stop:6449 length:762 start_codon:yes stop_codon:yes gene_type:complete